MSETHIDLSIDLVDNTQEQLEKYAVRYVQILDELMSKYPDGGITNVVMAGDIQTAEKMRDLVSAGKMRAADAVNFVGSYARFDFAIAQLTNDQLLDRLPELWIGCDPDDTELSYLALWRAAKKRNNDQIIKDGKALPQNRILYRGQDMKDPLGFSWTTDAAIAKKFAAGAGVRRPNRHPVIYRTGFQRSNVLAFLTGRGESEVILDIERMNLNAECFRTE